MHEPLRRNARPQDKARADEAPETGAAPSAPAARLLYVLVITLLIQALVVATVFAPTVIAPAILSALHLSPSAIGLFMSIVYVGGIASTLYSGPFIDRWGAIRTSQVCLLLCAAGSFLLATGSVALGIAGGLLIGLGYGPITPASSHILIRTTPAHRISTVFSIKQTGVPLGGAMVGLFVPPQQVEFGWTWAIVTTGIACIATAALAQTVRAELDVGLNAAGRRFRADLLGPIRLVLSRHALWILAACSFVFAGVQISLSAYLASYLNLDLGWTLLAAGLAMTAAQCAGMAGRIVWGAIADRWMGAHRTLSLLAVLMVGSCVAAGLLGAQAPHELVFAILVVFGGSAIGWNGVYLAEVARVAPPGQVSIATGGTLAFTFFGNMLWPPVFGLVSHHAGGYRFGYFFMCLPLLCCLWLLWGRRRSAASDTAA